MANPWQTPPHFTVAENPTAAKLNKIEDDLTALAAGARVNDGSNNQSIANNTNTSLTFSAENYDTDAIHDLVTNPTRLTCKTAGKYLIWGAGFWAVNASGYRALRLVLNNVTAIGEVYQSVAGTGGECTQQVSTIYALAVNDYIELRALQTSGGALNITNIAAAMHFLGG